MSTNEIVQRKTNQKKATGSFMGARSHLAKKKYGGKEKKFQKGGESSLVYESRKTAKSEDGQRRGL